MSSDLQLHVVAQGDRIVEVAHGHEITVNSGCRVENGAIVFDGSDSAFLELPALDVDFSHGLTVEAWVYYESFQAWSRILDFGNGQASDNVLLSQVETSRVPVFEVYTKGEKQQVAAQGEALELATWVHFAATLDPHGAAKIYVHGKELPLDAPQPLGLPRNVRRSKIRIGKSTWGDEKALQGRMLSLRLYGRALDATEIRVNMSEDLTGISHGASFPVDFHLHDGKRESVLYTLGGGQPLELEIVNTSRGDLTLPVLAGATAASKDQHHFALGFRPGTLHSSARAEEEIRLSEESAADWSLHRQDEPDGTAWLYLLRLAEDSVAPARSLVVRLANVVPDGRGGTRGTNVELLYRNVLVAGVPFEGRREHHLSVLHQRPERAGAGPAAAVKPLILQFVDGWDTILNRGQHTMTLRLLPNPDGDPSVTLGPDAELLLSAEDWSVMATGLEVSDFSEQAVAGIEARWSGVRQEFDGLFFVKFNSEVVLDANNKWLDFKVTLVAHGRPRQSYLKLHVENLPGHEDFDLYTLVRIGPMTMHTPVSLQNESLLHEGVHFTDGVTLWGAWAPLRLRADKYAEEVQESPAASITVHHQDHGLYVEAGHPQLTLQGTEREGAAEIVLDNTEAGAGHKAQVGVGGLDKVGRARDFYVNVADVEAVKIDTSGNVAVHGELKVTGTVGAVESPSLTVDEALYVPSRGKTADQHATVRLQTAGATGGDPFISWDVAYENGWAMGIDNSDDDKLKIGNAWNDVAAGDVLTMDRAGNVGVGTPNPKAKLDVDGNLNVEGRLDATGLSVQSGKRSGDDHPSGRPLYITGELKEESDGIEFRHSNGTQGVGFGYNTIYATGSNADQRLNLKARGKASVNIDGDLTIHGEKPITIVRYTWLGNNIFADTGYSSNDYAAAIVGFSAMGGDVDIEEGGGSPFIKMFMCTYDRTWHIRADLHTEGGHENWFVDVMFIRRNMVTCVGDWSPYQEEAIWLKKAKSTRPRDEHPPR